MCLCVFMCSCKTNFYKIKIKHHIVQDCPSRDCNKVNEVQYNQIIDTMTFVVNQCNYETTGFNQDLQQYTRYGKEVYGFFIYDLVKPTNNTQDTAVLFEIYNNHIYHFASYHYPESHNNILIVENGKIKIFTYLNCTEKGDQIEDVVQYIQKQQLDKLHDKKMIQRVKKFRNYGNYMTYSHHGSYKGDRIPRCPK